MEGKIFMEAFGERIRAARKAKGLSQSELAQATGLCVNSVGMIERGKKCPTVYTVQRICDSLHIAPGELFGGEGVVPAGEHGNDTAVRYIAQIVSRMEENDAERMVNIVTQAAHMGR